MIELRWLVDGQGRLHLQQRTCQVCVDASGAFCDFGEWSAWEPVPIVHNPDSQPPEG